MFQISSYILLWFGLGKNTSSSITGFKAIQDFKVSFNTDMKIKVFHSSLKIGIRDMQYEKNAENSIHNQSILQLYTQVSNMISGANVIKYHGKKPIIYRVKIPQKFTSYCSNLLSFQGKFNVINNPMVIYCHYTVITKVILLYNTEWLYDHGMAVNYCSKKFCNIGPWCFIH